MWSRIRGGLALAGLGALVGCNAVLGNEPGELANESGGSGGAAAASGAGGTSGAAGAGGQVETCWKLLDAATASVTSGSDKVQWAKRLGGLDDSSINSLALKNAQDLYVAGSASDTVTLDSGTVPIQGAFLARLNAYSGAVLAANQLPDAGWIAATGGSSNITAVIPFDQSITFGNQTVTAAGGSKGSVPGSPEFIGRCVQELASEQQLQHRNTAATAWRLLPRFLCVLGVRHGKGAPAF